MSSFTVNQTGGPTSSFCALLYRINPDFVALAESFGAKALRSNSPSELQASLEQAFEEPGPVIIEVPIERGSETSPWSLSHPLGTEVSKPASVSD